MSNPILEVRNLSKSFFGVKALDQVQLLVRPGEVHALMGENGAGKSTLMKILIGLLTPDSGEVIFEGQDLRNKGVNEVQKKGISMIHQEILVIPELTVAQNIFLGREREVAKKRSGWLDDTEINLKATELLYQVGLHVKPGARMGNLSMAEMQMVEIAKALSHNAKVIIMDEPTSAITDQEVETLFRIIKELKSRGVSILYISHKMDEIFRISDTITVLRDGRYIGTKKASELNSHSLIAMMVGREIENRFPPILQTSGEKVLEVKNLSVNGHFSNISFDVRAGEILGIAGLIGAGRTEIARAIYGLDRPNEGAVFMNGKAVSMKTPHDAVKHGIGYVSEDRKGLGFIPDMSVKQNLTLASLPDHQKGIFVHTKTEDIVATKMMADLRIKSTSIHQNVIHLSGGNQQKVVIGKVLLASPRVIILDEPTRGVDVGAKFEIYKLIRDLAEKGMAIILISSEMPEILGMSNRILVLSKGRITALLTREEATQESIMKYAVA